VYVSCYDKPENIRYLFSRVCVSLEVLCDRTFVNAGLWVVGSTEYFKRDTVLVL
jgi:hypothetical protein